MDREENGERRVSVLYPFSVQRRLVIGLMVDSLSGVRRLSLAIAEIILLADSKAPVTACLSVSYTQGEW